MCQEISMVMATEAYKINKSKTGHPVRANFFLTLISSRDELWKDMFCRLVEDEAMPYHATAIHRWMQEELQIKAAMRACIKDLRRERDKVRIAYY